MSLVLMATAWPGTMHSIIDLALVFSAWPATPMMISVFVICLLTNLWRLRGYRSHKGDLGSAAVEAPACLMSQAEAEDAVNPKDFPDLQIPRDVHVEIAIDPPCGLHFSNPEAAYSIDNEFATGTFIYFHKPTSSLRAGAGNLNFHKYFHGKKRLWELRFQLRFKRAPSPESEMFFGFQLDDYVAMNPAVQGVMNVAVAAMRRVAGGVYYSNGDDPEKITGECEQPTIVLPMWAFDQFIETPERQDPPSLIATNFPELGSCRKGRIQEYMQEVDAMQKNFRVGPTYTFAHWGTSRFADFVNWRLVGLPFVPPLSFKRLTGPSLVRVVLYSLRPAGDATSGKDEANGNRATSRHLASRKDHYFRAGIWSSNERPRKHLFKALTGATEAKSSAQSPGHAVDAASGNGIRKRTFDVFSCCIAGRGNHCIAEASNSS